MLTEGKGGEGGGVYFLEDLEGYPTIVSLPDSSYSSHTPKQLNSHMP